MGSFRIWFVECTKHGWHVVFLILEWMRKTRFVGFIFLTHVDTPEHFAYIITGYVVSGINSVCMYTNGYMILHVGISNFPLKTRGKITPQVRYLAVRNRIWTAWIQIKYFCCNNF